jgi:shikimate dehydrogenase
MHEAEGARLGLDYSYSLLDVDRLGLPETSIGRFIACAAGEGFAGLNVTHPFKQSVIPYLDRLTPEAEAIGAVNTVVFQAGEAIGHNTDCWGFAESFRRDMAGAGLRSVLLLGAGGAGKAVAQALTELGAEEIVVFDVDRGRSESLVAQLNADSGRGRARLADNAAAEAGRVDGIVNASPTGMAKYPGTPVPAEALAPEAWVADIVYFPARTELLRLAEGKGCRVLPGRGMAIYQAVMAFKLITGVEPDPYQMARHFEDAPA